MGRLFLLHDFSPSRPWLYALLQANRKRLASQGLEFGPFNPFSTEWQLSHEHFFRQFDAKNPPSANIKSLWQRLAAQIAVGDVLLYTHKPFAAAHDGFRDMLQKNVALAPENIRQLFIIAQPGALIEQRFREFPGLAEKTGNDLAQAYSRLLMLREAASERLGENLRLIANKQPGIASKTDAELASQVFAFLGRDADLDAADNFLHPLRYQSATGRQLSRLSGVRWNGYKPLAAGKYAQTLANLDQEWGEDFASPLALRQKLTPEQSSQVRLLAKKLDLAPIAPDAPLLTAAPVSEAAPLAADRSLEFATALDTKVRAQLLERYQADAAILVPRQKQFYDDLLSVADESGAPKSAEFAQIGETEPPVELTVLTMAYNHEKYIAECMDSVLAQKTDFPVRHIVLDHNSTDGTADIIREYAAKHPSIHPALLTRRVPNENVRGLFMRCKTKYAALCDGDDYFYAPDKLQKQVDYLENRPHCSMCFHPVAVTFEDGTKPFRFPPMDMLPINKKMEFHLAQLTKHNFIQTNSVVYRWRFRDGLPAWFRADLCPGDWYWHMLHAEVGRVGFLPETMSVYRRHKGALYNAAFKDPEAHWRNRGLTELHAYKAYNDHFKDRYFKNFSILASGIFAAFFRIAENEADRTLLERAEELYPKFALEFYESLNKMDSQAATGKNVC